MNNVKDLQTIEETLKYLQFDNWEQSAPGLARSRELLGLLGNPEQKLKFVHIAGTNGKGSTAAMLASVLQRAGYRTGLYTSPHLLRFHERMRVNGEEIDDNSLISLTNTVRNAAESMSEMPTSPKERVTPSNSPTTRLVRISGMTTRKKAATGPAPVTRAASVSLRTVSLPSAAWTGLMTRGSPAM